MRAKRAAPAVAPVAFPVMVTEQRSVSRQALIHWRGNPYSVPPELAMTRVIVHQHLGAEHIEITTTSGATVARHRLAEPGLGIAQRTDQHVTSLESIALASAPPGRPHCR